MDVFEMASMESIGSGSMVSSASGALSREPVDIMDKYRNPFSRPQRSGGGARATGSASELAALFFEARGRRWGAGAAGRDACGRIGQGEKQHGRWVGGGVGEGMLTSE